MKKLQWLQNWLIFSGLNKEAATLDKFLKYSGIKEELILQNPEYEDNLNEASKTVKPNHLRWFVIQLNNNEPFTEIVNTIAEFEKFKPRLEIKDLYQYATLGDLRGAIEAGGESNSEKKKQLKEKIEGTYDILYNNDNYLVVHPYSKEASCYFGQGTKWCVSATVSENYFNQYANDNVFLYFIISKGKKDSNMSKIAYAFSRTKNLVGREDETEEIFNANDDSITDGTVQRYLGKFYNEIRSSIDNHFNSQKNTKQLNEFAELTVEKFIKKLESMDERERSRYIPTVSKNHFTPVEVLDYIASRIGEFEFEYAFHLIIYNLNTSDSTLRMLALLPNTNWEEASGIIKNPNVSKETIDLIAKKNTEPVYEEFFKTIVAQSPKAAPETLAFLSTTPFASVKADVAKNQNTPKEVLINLAKDSDSYVWMSVFRNIAITQEVINALSEERKLEMLVSEPYLSDGTLYLLSKDPSVQVRTYVAMYPTIPYDILVEMLNDPDKNVAYTATQYH